MKSLRRSLNSNNHHHGHGAHGSGSGHGGHSSHSHSSSQGGAFPMASVGHAPSASGGPGHGGGGGSGGGSAGFSANPLSRPTDKVAPPQKVIKALNSHRSTNPQELSYTQGHFWYVIGEREGWYEALDPITSSRGLVPKEDFEEFNKGGRQAVVQNQQSPTSQHTRSLSHSQNSNGPRSPPMQQMQMHPSPPAPAHHIAGGPAVGGPVVGGPAVGMPAGKIPGGKPSLGGMGGMAGLVPTLGPGGKKHQPLYAIVQYDFHAERPDELEAKAGEPIVVIAQSNHEWFVAKPIGRLGGPGLIPVAFVEIRDPVTGKPVDVFPTTIPQVEEWKKATAEYKAAAIVLGRFDPNQRVANSPFSEAATHTTANSSSGHGDPDEAATAITSSTGATARGVQRSVSSAGANGGASKLQHGSATGSDMSNQRYKPEHDIMLPPGELLELGVPSFHNESGNYWFRLQTVYLPDQPSEPAYTLILYRTYEDFYDFQIMLLDTFPTEAGRPADPEHSPPERLLPFMPGPVEEAIDDELTEYRRSELDAYVRSLLDLRNKGVGYVLRDELVRTFFAAKYGDFWEVSPRPENVEHLADRMAGVGIKPMPGQHARNAPEHSGGGNGWTFPTASGGPGERGDPYQQAVAAQHTRNVSSTGSNNINNLSVNTQNANSQHQQWSNNPSHNKHGPDGYNSALSAVTPVLPTLSQAAPAPPVPMHHNSKSLQAPPRPDAAFVKIKIYDRATDDIIALRVHPAVTYVELLDKVRARLGGSISVLQYRVGGGGGGGAGSGPTRQIRDDRDLGEWMASEDQRLMLYAEQA